MCVGFCHEHALILYVTMNNGIDESDGSVLTVCIAMIDDLILNAKLYD
jgi:hypothetical protein